MQVLMQQVYTYATIDIDSDIVEIHEKARDIFGGDADLGSGAKIVLPSSTARPVFVVSAGIRGIDLSPIFPGALHNAQPSGFGCGSDDHVAIDRIVRRDGRSEEHTPEL